MAHSFEDAPLESVRPGNELAVDPQARPAANCRLEPCGSSALPAEVAERIRSHPCFGEDAHHHFARLHLPVAAGCNIQCHYCNRRHDCASENRPGVTSRLLSPDEALAEAVAVAGRLPALSVVGIAGPGDPLANPAATLRTLELVKRDLPDLTLCLSTNGLALPEHVDALADLGLGHLTVTVNAADPVVGERIHPWVNDHGQRWRGREAAALLFERQREGIARAVARGLLVKVNTVLVPGVNDAHIAELSRVIRGLGAFIHNVMPLLVAPEYGTFYSRTGQRAPTDQELEKARASCGAMRAMRHCRGCRADAVGRLGARGAPPVPVHAPAVQEGAEGARGTHRAAVERLREQALAAREEALARLRDAPSQISARVAVVTRGDGLVNEHFGRASELQIYQVDRRGARLVGIRRFEGGCRCEEDDGDDGMLSDALRALEGCAAVLAARIGHWPRTTLQRAGVEAVTDFAYQPIEAAALAWFQGFSEKSADRACGNGLPAIEAASI